MPRIDRFLKTTWLRFYVRGDAERDPGFRNVIMRLTRGGMVVAAVLALLIDVVYFVSYLLRGKGVSVSYVDRGSVVLWDELIILLGCGAMLWLANTYAGQRHGRFLVTVLTVIASLAILFEDGASGDFSFTAGYLSLALVVVCGTMPFRPIHMLFLGLGITVLYVFFISFAAPALYGVVTEIDSARVVYLTSLALMLTGMSAVLYTSRYRQYRARKRLAATQEQLIQSEKLASLGQLTAGIAHEIKNPLNFINNFAELNVDHVETLDEILAERKLEMAADLHASLSELLEYLRLNAVKIREQGQRADAIVRAMMLHARGAPGGRELTDLNALVDEYVSLASYGIGITNPEPRIEIARTYDARVGTVAVVPQDLARVVINLLNNAFDAVVDRASQVNGQFTPRVTVSTERTSEDVVLRVRDNGTGIAPEIRSRIFDPFFTTKPAGKGTGLGLSMSYDIVVRGHGGKIDVQSQPGEGTEFIVLLPAAHQMESAQQGDSDPA